MKNRTALLAAVVVAAAAQASLADTVNIESLQLGASFTGSLTYAPTTAGHGTLTVSLTNTSDVHDRLTALAFDFASSDPHHTANLLSGPAHFVNLTNGHRSAGLFGVYQAGSGIDNQFLSGGNVSNGLAVGQSGTWTFTITASDAAALDAADFLQGPNLFDFVVRFRDLPFGAAATVPVLFSHRVNDCNPPVTTQGGPSTVPVPPALFTGALGLIGAGGVTLRRVRRCKAN